MISQIEIGEMPAYDRAYIENNYCTYSQKCREMAHLRFGYICGALGAIPDSVLDIGYGSGEFLSVAAQIVPRVGGHDITGINPPAGVEFITNIYESEWDVVTFFDVLEHFKDPREVVSRLDAQHIAISLPWCHYVNDEWFAEWKHRKPNEHLHHFNAVSLAAMMRECGYRLITSPTEIEDTIRKELNGLPNILTCIFQSR